MAWCLLQRRACPRVCATLTGAWAPIVGGVPVGVCPHLIWGVSPKPWAHPCFPLPHSMGPTHQQTTQFYLQNSVLCPPLHHHHFYAPESLQGHSCYPDDITSLLCSQHPAASAVPAHSESRSMSLRGPLVSQLHLL